MKLHAITTLGIHALVLTTGSALALPRNTPADEHPDATTDIQTHNASVTDSAPSTTVTDDVSEQYGPPSGLPGLVPDHVAELHETIRSFPNGQLDSPLSNALGDLLGTTHANRGPDGNSPD